MSETPTLREILAGYRQFNTWEAAERQRTLPQLTIEESLAQFFELCDLAHGLTTEAGPIFLEQDKAHWITLHQKLRQAARVMGYAKTT